MNDRWDPDLLNASLAGAPAEEVLRWAIREFSPRLALATSFQVDGMVILDMASRIGGEVHVFSVDTGRLHTETHELVERVESRYGIRVAMYYPDTAELEAFVHREGPNAFYRDVALRLRCCEIRKVNPVARALQGHDAWITGQRRQHGTTRAHLARVERDERHGILKVNPLADWTDEQVWEYIHRHKVPYNSLYDQGYTSIGCAPCTRPTRAGEDPRAGRWWWEQGVAKECGIHRVPVAVSGLSMTGSD